MVLQGHMIQLVCLKDPFGYSVERPMDHWETISIIQARVDAGLDLCSNSRGGEKRLGSGYILKVKSPGLLDMGV